MIFRLCREVDGQIVDLKEIEADTIEEAIAIYRGQS